jgi:segregation and condensation protein B
MTDHTTVDDTVEDTTDESTVDTTSDDVDSSHDDVPDSPVDPSAEDPTADAEVGDGDDAVENSAVDDGVEPADVPDESAAPDDDSTDMPDSIQADDAAASDVVVAGGAGSSDAGEHEGGSSDAGEDLAGQTEIPVGAEEVVDDETMRRALEAILMVADEPLPSVTLAQVVGRPTQDVAAALAELSAEYGEQGRGFDLREVAGGWRYYTREEAAPYVERFVLDGQQARLTQAALETLSVVAYKQPVSRARVSAIRGVNVDGVMRTLVTRGLVEEAGADTESQATLYRTTSYFLERMGMQSLDDLPELAPYLPEMDDIEDELAQAAPRPAPQQPDQEPEQEPAQEPETDKADD